MSELLDVQAAPAYDSSVTKIDDITVSLNNPSATGVNDVCQFSLNQSDTLILLKESYFTVHGQIVEKGKETKPVHTTLCNAGVLHLFSRAELRINNQTVEQVSEPGITLLSKIMTTYDVMSVRHLELMGWNNSEDIIADDGSFNLIIPFKLLFGLGEDFRKVLINAKVEVLLTRSRSNDDALVLKDTTKTEKTELTIHKMQFRIPFVSSNDAYRLQFLKIIEQDQALPINFRSWNLYQYPYLPATKKHVWHIRGTSSKTPPRYVIVNFQSGRSGDLKKSSSETDHCDLSIIQLRLNQELYPVETVDQSFKKLNYSLFYKWYSDFSSVFSGKPDQTPMLDYENFKTKGPVFIIDCSYHQELVKSGAIDISLYFESETPFPPNTTANCIIVQDESFEYYPLTSRTVRNEV